MHNFLVSIVVPVYNVETYLVRCIDSIISQTYKNIEILLIDDGSTDNSGTICDQYKQQNRRIIVIHQKNQGLSAARNVGIAQAHGEYITFVDSDDIVADFYIDTLLNACIENHAQISVGNHKSFSQSKIEFSKNKLIDFKNYTPLEAEKRLVTNEIVTTACTKLYDRSLFNNISFPIGYIYEDLGTIYKLFYKANKIVQTDQIIYGYFIRNDSISHSPYSIKNLDFFKLAIDRANFFKDIDEELYIIFLDTYVTRIENEYGLIFHDLKMKNAAKQLKKEFFKYVGKIIKSKYISIKHKLSLITMIIVPFSFHLRITYLNIKEKLKSIHS